MGLIYQTLNTFTMPPVPNLHDQRNCFRVKNAENARNIILPRIVNNQTLDDNAATNLTAGTFLNKFNRQSTQNTQTKINKKLLLFVLW